PPQMVPGSVRPADGPPTTAIPVTPMTTCAAFAAQDSLSRPQHPDHDGTMCDANDPDEPAQGTPGCPSRASHHEQPSDGTARDAGQEPGAKGPLVDLLVPDGAPPLTRRSDGGWLTAQQLQPALPNSGTDPGLNDPTNQALPVTVGRAPVPTGASSREDG